jgi:hypothetical protein
LPDPGKARNAPAEGEPLAGLPVAHGPDFPFFAIVEARDEAAAWPGGIKAQRAIALGESGKSGWLFHHRPMPSVKAANATSGEAAMRRATMTASSSVAFDMMLEA